MMCAAQSDDDPTGHRSQINLSDLAIKKSRGEPIVMVTAYDYVSAQIAEHSGVDIVLVGDTAAMTTLGYAGTERVSFAEMLMLGRAVRRGLRTPLMVGDMPMGTYETSDRLAVQSAQRLIKETGCDVVKLEGAGTSIDRARAIVRSGIAVMGHLGLTPQTRTALGGFRTQGKTSDAAERIVRDAQELQRAGCFALVLEAIPAQVASLIARRLEIPVIGIGAGAQTDGQVLVFNDLLGIFDAFKPKFVKRYAALAPAMSDALARYTNDVRTRRYPADEHTYDIAPQELRRFREALSQPPA
jgi:3-methyl-2-oxobutanoate hydroxymethyltransferase